MKLSQLRYFCSACKHQNITKAANELYISQPSISTAIKELETEFGVTLLHRMGRGLTLTQEGVYFLERANQLLEYADQLSQIMCDIGSKRNRINLGVPPMIGTFLFPELYMGFKKEYPQIELNSQEGGTKDLLRMLDEGLLDLAIVPSNSLSKSEYNILNLVQTETVFCVAKDHPLARQTSVSIPMIQNEPLVMFREGFYQNDVVKQRYEQYGVEPNILHYSSQFYTIQEFIVRRIAAGFMFRDIVKKVPELVGIPLEDPVLIQVSLVWGLRQHMFSDVSKFIWYAKDFSNKKSYDI